MVLIAAVEGAALLAALGVLAVAYTGRGRS